ncbi:hypothetical protein GCM10027343_14570 [Noviherbaspirillum agri]
MIAAEIERDKQGHFTILNEQDAAIFESRRNAHRKMRTEAARDFLASLPSRYPSFGATLFADIRRHVEQEVAEQHKRPDIREAVASLFESTINCMPESMRDAVKRAAHILPRVWTHTVLRHLLSQCWFEMGGGNERALGSEFFLPNCAFIPALRQSAQRRVPRVNDFSGMLGSKAFLPKRQRLFCKRVHNVTGRDGSLTDFTARCIAS